MGISATEPKPDGRVAQPSAAPRRAGHVAATNPVRKLQCPSMASRNERRTEGIVRSFFASDRSVANLRIEEQIPTDPTLRRLLANASKSGAGVGRPEFLLTSPEHPDLVVLVECKADARRHASRRLDRPAEFAADGAIHYAGHLSKAFDVIAIAVSGETRSTLRVSTYTWFQGQLAHGTLQDETGDLTELRQFAEYVRLRAFDPAVRKRNQARLMRFSRDLHNYLRDYAKLAEAEKPLVVSAVMLALHDAMFWRSHRSALSDELPRVILEALARQFKRAQIPVEKQRVIEQPYQFLEHHAVLNRIPKDEVLSPLQRIVLDVDDQVRPFLLYHPDVDVLGQFYGEFLRYSGGDGKGLGIVLTPRHVTELFALLANVGPHDTVLDTCCGTGGFLISAMAQMDDRARGRSDLREKIRSQGLVGVEQRPDMFALAVANMILRGDGKANLYQADSFDSRIAQAITTPDPRRHARPNIGFINPPYSQKGAGLDELSFVKTLLDYLTPGGTGIAIVPMSVAITPQELKGQIFARHSLLAVMSMPNDLFHKVGTITCVMVWRAHTPHDPTVGTWLGYWKDDGFIKTKRSGRVDRDGRWPAIREQWLSAYHRREELPGHSVIAHLTADDEWVAEAHMETDYSSLSQKDFAEVVREYALYLVDLRSRERA